MDQLESESKVLLADALIAEQNGDWLNAIEKRESAISKSLGRQAIDPKPRTSILDYQLTNPENDLEALGNIHHPSKISHDYLRRYWRHFQEIRMSARKVVEVGVQTARSIEMWEEFFPNAIILGIDIDPACADFSGGRKKVFIGDQMNEAFLMEFINETGGNFDVVIDDGLHPTHSMFKTFSYLYPALQSHGIYVIEDIQANPEVVRFLGNLMNYINYVPPNFDLRNWPKLTAFPTGTPWLYRNTVGVAFYRYIAFIERGFNPRDNPFLREPVEFDKGLVEHRANVMKAVRALENEGKSINLENLIEKLGRLERVHIDRYLLDPTSVN